jgi:hypothetical protein
LVTSCPETAPGEADVFGIVQLKLFVQVPSAVMVKSISTKVVLPSVLDRADPVVIVAVPHVGAAVPENEVHAVPVSPVPPLATGSGEVIEITPPAEIAIGAVALSAPPFVVVAQVPQVA